MPTPSALTVQAIAITGVEVTLGAADTNGNFFTNNGKTFLVVNNASGNSIDVMIASPTPCNQGATHNITVAVAAGKTKYIGPFDYWRFSPNGVVNITYSAVTSVTVAAVSL